MTSDLPCPVLIVCDDALVRRRAIAALFQRGCRTIETHDAEIALGVLEHHREIRGLVIAAGQLGALNGYDLARIAARERPDIRHVVIIGPQPPGPGELAREAYFLPDPLDLDALFSALRQKLRFDR